MNTLLIILFFLAAVTILLQERSIRHWYKEAKSVCKIAIELSMVHERYAVVLDQYPKLSARRLRRLIHRDLRNRAKHDVDQLNDVRVQAISAFNQAINSRKWATHIAENKVNTTHTREEFIQAHGTHLMRAKARRKHLLPMTGGMKWSEMIKQA